MQSFSYKISESQKQKVQYSKGNTVNNVVIMFYVAYIDFGEHWVMYGVVTSICCTPETSITLCVNYISIKNTLLKQTWGTKLIFSHNFKRVVQSLKWLLSQDLNKGSRIFLSVTRVDIQGRVIFTAQRHCMNVFYFAQVQF